MIFMPLLIKNGLKTLAVFVVAGLLLSCQSTPPKPYSCTLPTGYKVESAFASANADLVHLQCHYQFEQYMNRLLEIAASNPKEKNKQYFSDFLSQARDNGILSQLQAKEYYRRYFTSDFVSLGRMHNNCSTTCQKQAEISKNLKSELRDKELGLLKVVGDQQGYTRADREFNQLLTLIDATCLACQSTE